MKEMIDEIYQSMLSPLQVRINELRLNKRLISIQGLSEVEVIVIKKLHIELQDYFEEVKNTNPHDWTKADQQRIITEVERIEFAMQKAWKFEVNANYHSWWNKVPHCTCPLMDNQDAMGSKMRYFSSVCLLHSNPETQFYGAELA